MSDPLASWMWERLTEPLHDDHVTLNMGVLDGSAADVVSPPAASDAQVQKGDMEASWDGEYGDEDDATQAEISHKTPEKNEIYRRSVPVDVVVSAWHLGAWKPGLLHLDCNERLALAEDVKSSVSQKLKKVQGTGGDQSWWICRVHPRIKEQEREAYEPKLISIGPLHHGKENLLPMEETKLRYMNALLDRSPTKNRLSSYIEAIAGIEHFARKEYREEEIKGLKPKEFVEMLFVDGCFLIEYLLRAFYKEDQETGINDSQWSVIQLRRDLMLLENQIPFSVLVKLFGQTDAYYIQTKSPKPCCPLSLMAIALEFLYAEDPTEMYPKADEVHHLLHLNHLVLNPTDTGEHGQSPASLPITRSDTLIKKLFVWLLFLLVNEWPSSPEEPDRKKEIPCATDLDMYGVKFMWSRNYNFSFKDGTLEVHGIRVGQSVRRDFRNFIALEQCRPRDIESHFSSYVCYMNHIVCTQSDVAVLRKHGIIEIFSGSDEDVVKMFQSISEGTGVYKMRKRSTSNLFECVNAYCDDRYRRWRGRLRRSSYLRRPWSAVAFMVGFLMLGLTAVQTGFTIRQSLN